MTTQEEVPEFDLDKMLSKIGKLLDRADHENTPEHEAASCRAKAEQLMQQYRINESLLIDSQTSNLKPIVKSLHVSGASNEFAIEYWSILYYVASHCGLRSEARYGRHPETQEYGLIATLVGYESDIRYANVIYTGARLAFASFLEPKVDPDASDADNVYRLRNAGIERGRIAVLLWGDRSKTGKVTPLYKKACAERGEDPVVVGKSISAKGYRKSFGEGFLNTIIDRLHQMRVQDGVSDSGELVLAGRKEAVDEAFYEKFPEKRPQEPRPGSKVTAKRRRSRRPSGPKFSSAGFSAGGKAAYTADLRGGRAPKGGNTLG